MKPYLDHIAGAREVWLRVDLPMQNGYYSPYVTACEVSPLDATKARHLSPMRSCECTEPPATCMRLCAVDTRVEAGTVIRVTENLWYCCDASLTFAVRGC
jgi:hypothetical protein